MKIHGKTLEEILEIMPWPYKLVVILGTACILFTLIYIPYTISQFGKEDLIPHVISMRDTDGIHGLADPSISYDPSDKNGAVYMAFTSVHLGTDDVAQLGAGVTLALGNQACKIWVAQTKIFEPKNDDLIGPDSLTPIKKGVWRIETPSIVFDPSDMDAPWKVYAYKYFWAGDENLARLYGVIVQKTAASIYAPWSNESWVFSASGRTPPQPYNQLVQQHLNDLHPDLKDVYFYARPSVVHARGVLFMTLSAFTLGKTTPDRVILLASTNNGKKWQYIGTPLTDKDVSSLDGYRHLAGATLLQDKDSIFLAAVFSNDVTQADGTHLFEFTNILKGQIKRDAKTGQVIEKQHVPLSSVVPTVRGGGFAAYTEKCPTSGLITSEFSTIQKSFQLFETYSGPLKKDQ